MVVVVVVGLGGCCFFSLLFGCSTRSARKKEARVAVLFDFIRQLRNHQKPLSYVLPVSGRRCIISFSLVESSAVVMKKGTALNLNRIITTRISCCCKPKKTTCRHYCHCTTANGSSCCSSSSSSSSRTTTLALIAHLIIIQAFIFRRCCHKHQTHLVSSVVAGFLLLIFAIVSVLAPSPTSPINSAPQHHLSLIKIAANAVVLDSRPEFHVPEDGGKWGRRNLWSWESSSKYYGCSNSTTTTTNNNKRGSTDDVKVKPYPNRYLMTVASGGLNQQRTGIIDAVVAAHILNATLVIPELDQNSFWKDASNFSDIFDVDWFISSLSDDVEIIKQPPKLRKGWKVATMRVPRKCTPKCYENRVLPVLNKRHVVQLTKFDYRLSNELATDLQKLRCRVNYHALKFTDPIVKLGETIVERMRMESRHFIALHLRFEPDMLAFSGCDYGGGTKEQSELGVIRKRWKTLRATNPERARRQGKCPLSPEEVGLMLRALGYGSDVHIYVASGEVYGGEEALAPLKALFPNYHSKESLASQEELAPFTSFSSRMAALDFIACDESDVFVTNNNGNMARILAGRRRYLGHKPTIRPNAKKLYRLFMNRNNMTWEEFSSRVRTSQIGFMGDPNEIKPGTGEFHENPVSCICERSVDKNVTDSSWQRPPYKWQGGRAGNGMKKENAAEFSDEASPVDDQELDYEESENIPRMKEIAEKKRRSRS